jgi:hypothetical protein
LLVIREVSSRHPCCRDDERAIESTTYFEDRVLFLVEVT